MKRITFLTVMVFSLLIPVKITFAQVTQATEMRHLGDMTAKQVDSELQELRPSITFDMNMGLDNSDFQQGDRGETQVGYGYQHISMLLELPTSNYTMIRFGLERIEHSFKQVNDKPGFYDRDLMYATYNIRLGLKFYLDGK